MKDVEAIAHNMIMLENSRLAPQAFSLDFIGIPSIPQFMH